MIESNTNRLELSTLSVESVKPLLDFAYSGKLSLSMSIVHGILSSATFLQITAAIDLCTQFLKSHMTFHNADKIQSLSSAFGLTAIQHYHRRMILDHFLEYAQTDNFLQLEPKLLSTYLIDDSLRTSTEAKLLKCVLAWYHYDISHREKYMPDILDKIRYTLDGWPIIDYASHLEPFISNEQCQQVLECAQQYMQNASRKHLNQSYRTRVRYDKKTLVQIGGVKVFQRSLLDFEFTSEDYDSSVGGYKQWHYFHRDQEKWLPLGVIGQGDSRSHCPLVEVNDYGVLVGGYLYTSDFVHSYQHCSNEVKLFAPSGFALWDLPYMHEPRTHHAAVHAEGRSS